jgi:adenylate cyclase
MQTKIILKNGGTIDKYMGDCIMAFWNAPLDCEDHPSKAVETAREIIEATERLNIELEPLKLPPINVGIGVNTGDCIVGNMGSELRFDYSVIGDAVNLGARLEAQAARGDYLDHKVLISEFTYMQCPEIAFTLVDTIKVKGKEEPITIYSLDK